MQSTAENAQFGRLPRDLEAVVAKPPDNVAQFSELQERSGPLRPGSMN
jgi:hypothetical protein